MRNYSLVDRVTGETTDTDGLAVERITGIEVSYIDWVIEQDGRFENGDWLITKPT